MSMMNLTKPVKNIFGSYCIPQNNTKWALWEKNGTMKWLKDKWAWLFSPFGLHTDNQSLTRGCRFGCMSTYPFGSMAKMYPFAPSYTQRMRKRWCFLFLIVEGYKTSFIQWIIIQLQYTVWYKSTITTETYTKLLILNAMIKW